MDTIGFSYHFRYRSMKKHAFYYVYILQSAVGTERFYTGFTEQNRLSPTHNH